MGRSFRETDYSSQNHESSIAIQLITFVVTGLLLFTFIVVIFSGTSASSYRNVFTKESISISNEPLVFGHLPEDRKNMFTLGDTNKDGQISRTEWMEMYKYNLNIIIVIH